jgi:hypothetical protein
MDRRRRTRRRNLAFAAALAVSAAFADPALAQTTYGVFCANGRIEIDSRSEAEMKRQRGACQLARFSFRMDAESFARKNFKAVGAPCSCR